jgi:hypothetical protein
MSISSQDLKYIQAEYPMLTVRWSEEKCLFEVREKYRKGCETLERVIWDYENPDGSRFPFIPAHCLAFMRSIDTRKWPLKDRIRIAREERRKFIDDQYKALRNHITDHITDNLPYFTTRETFFMDPRSMPVWKTTLMPSQARALKSMQGG